MKKYVFKPYSKIFPELFQIERERIVSHVNMQLVIEHIGSTAVPGLGGKGIIDIAIAVAKEDMNFVSKQLQVIGYEFRPAFSTPDRLYFVTYLPDPEIESRRYHIHVTYPENTEWKEFLGFRDYLRSHPKAAQEYAALKERAALEANDEGEKYRKLKEPIFKKVNSDIDTGIDEYQQLLHLQAANFSLIVHDDAMVSIVYKIVQPTGEQLILKICDRAPDYLREVHFLKLFAGVVPVPKIIQVVEPSDSLHGAILMECLQGTHLNPEECTEALAYEIGRSFALIHLHRLKEFGDPMQGCMYPDPRTYYTLKFNEGIEECKEHLPANLIEQCRHYFQTHIDDVVSVDGPCVVHRDFRPGNLIVHESKLQGIIDWAGARASFAEEDLCSLEHGEWARKFRGKKPLLEGYASVRPVPDYARLCPILRFHRAVTIVGFTVKRGTWNNTSSRVYQYNRCFLESCIETL